MKLSLQLVLQTFILNIPGKDMPHVQDAWKVLSNEQFPAGRIVVIGGGLVGAETAEYLALRGNDVSIVEMMDTIAKEESTTIRPEMMADFEKHGVKQFTNTKVTEITATTVEAETAEGKVSLPCDYVVFAVGARSNAFDMTALEEKNIHVQVVGDANKVADINSAIESGYLAANAL